MTTDEACWERGCACHDSRDSPGVELVLKREWVSLTDDEIDIIYQGAGKHDLLNARAIEAKLKERNT